MLPLLKPKLHNSASPLTIIPGIQCFPFSFFCPDLPPPQTSPHFQEICDVVSCEIGGLDELEASLNLLKASITSNLVTQVIDSCKTQVPTRRLLRFFSWSNRTLDHKLGDEAFNYAIRVFAEKKDLTALDILILDLRKEHRAMELETFGIVAETLVKFGREDEAVGLFKNLEKLFKCPKDRDVVIAIVQALCAKGHARIAEGVVFHNISKISGVEKTIYKSLLHGWCVYGNVKEARKIIIEMKLLGIQLDLFCYNTLLRCLCTRNLKFNPSGLVPEALSTMVEMRSNGISPNTISFNILLSCLARTRRVKEACRILNSMKNSGCSPNWVSYYLVVRVLYLSGRFGKGNKVVDEMIENGLIPEPRFYLDLVGVLCGVERVGHALELFERMKKSCMGDRGPVYDLLIPKLCWGGEFDKGRQLWDEAIKSGVILECSSNVLDPSVTEVFMPVKKVDEGNMIKIMAKAKKKKKNVSTN